MRAIIIGGDDALRPHVRRELLNADAELEAEFPAAAAAIDALRASRSERRLVLLHLASPDDIDRLRRLSDTLVGWPIVALMDPGGESSAVLSSTFLSAMRAGASQIVPLPLSPRDFHDALERVTTQFVSTPGVSNVVVVAGATGGSGATTVAINLAYEVAHGRGLRTILVDLSLNMGVVASNLDLEPERTIHDLLRDVDRVDSLLLKRALVKVGDRLQVLAGPHRAVTPISATSQEVMRVVDVASELADVVILDVPCTYDDFFFDLLGSGGRAVLIGEQKVPSVRALKLIREALGRDRASRPDQLAINRYDPRLKGFTVDRIAETLGVPALRTIAEDRAGVLAAANSGCALRLQSPQSPVLADLDALADALLGDGAAAGDPKRPGLLGRLRRAFANT
jgi:pilus assembly protein CpaE